MKKSLIIIVILLASALSLTAQDNNREVSNYISLNPQFVQIKEGLNYGLVNNGMNLDLEYTRVSSSDSKTFIYSAELGFGANYRQGLGLNWVFKPLDVFYGFKLTHSPAIEVILGPYMQAYYMWQLFPELQSGHLFWLSSYEIGPRILLTMPVKNKILSLSLANSVLSLNSRPENKTEEYFYSLTFADFAGNPHSNMSLGFQDTYNHVDLELTLSDPNKRFSIGYGLEYYGYLAAPEFDMLTHSINLKWKIGHEK